MSDKKRGKTKLKLFLLAIMVTAPVVIAVIFADYRSIPDKVGENVTSSQDSANISVTNVRQTAARDGITEWNLDADSVRYANEKKQALFENLSVIFFLKNREKLRLKADQGILKTDSNDIEVSGNVLLTHGNYRLETETLHYDHNRRVFSSESPVRIRGNAFDLEADAVSFDLNAGKAFFKGNVKGVASENIPL